MRTVVLPDIHGESRPVATALKETGYLKPKGNWQLCTDGEFSLVTLGDHTDRGRHNRQVMEMLAAFKRQLRHRMITLAGNHCIAREQAMRRNDVHCLLEWMKMGGMTLLREFSPPRSLRERRTIQDFPASLSALSDDDSDEIQMDWIQLIDHDPDLRKWDIGRGLRHARDFFRQREIAKLFESAKLVHAAGDVLMAHAGIGRLSCIALSKEGPDGINAEFRQCAAQDDFRRLLSKALSPVTWMSRDKATNGLLSAEVLGAMKARGLRVLIRGHNADYDGKQRVFVEQDILEIDADTGMHAGNPSCVEIDDTTGRIRTWNAKEGWKVVREKS